MAESQRRGPLAAWVGGWRSYFKLALTLALDSTCSGSADIVAFLFFEFGVDVLR